MDSDLSLESFFEMSFGMEWSQEAPSIDELVVRENGESVETSAVQMAYDPPPPPDQDSPNHIVNILNDDCIIEILRKFENRKDFCNAASACQRFQAVAVAWFSNSNMSSTLRIGGTYRKSSFCSKLGTFTPQAPFVSAAEINEFMDDLYQYLSIFGKCIRTVEWTKIASVPDAIDARILKMIARFCRKTLIHLNINGVMNISITSEFKVLQRFELFHGTLHKFTPSHALEYLRLTRIGKNSYQQPDLSFLKRTFPNLVEVHFGDFVSLMSSFNWFKCFVEKNPQLKKLTMLINKYFSSQASAITRDISTQLPNLESLHLDLFPVNIQDLSGLKQLKCLRIPYRLMNDKQMDALISLGLPIEELEIGLQTGDRHIAKRISELDEIRKLNLAIRTVRNRPIYNIIEVLPPLDSLNLQEVKTSEMDNIRRFCKNIKKVTYKQSASN